MLRSLLAACVLLPVLAGCAAPDAPPPAPTGTQAPAGTPAPSSGGGTPEAPPLDPPEGAADETVLATATGRGSAVGASGLDTDGSYTLYAVCHGGGELSVTSSRTESVTPVPCSGHVSRLQFLADAGPDDLGVVAEPGQQWAITVTDSREA